MRGGAGGVRRAVRRFVVLALAGAIVVPAIPAGAALPRTASVKQRVTVANGVVYRRIVDTQGPWIIHVVKVDVGVAARPDTVLAGDRIFSYAYTSDIGRNMGALAAINGDFGGRHGIPSHEWSGDGALLTSGTYPGDHFAWSARGTGGWVGDGVEIWAKDLTTGAKGHRVIKWNVGVPADDQVRGYTDFGGSKIHPPDNACGMRLTPKGPYRWEQGSAVSRKWLVDVQWCGQSAMKVLEGSIVLSSKRSGKGSEWIKQASAGDTIITRWHPGEPNVLDMVGGQPTLLQDSAIVATNCDSYTCNRHPRTAIGAMAGGETLLVVVDGRKPSSVGMTPVSLARYMRRLGAVDALNLDGGGGSVMWVQGLGIVNEPSDGDGDERPVTNAVIVLPGADPGESDLRGFRAATTSYRAEPTFELVTGSERLRAIRRAMRDPASTGGLEDLFGRR